MQAPSHSRRFRSDSARQGSALIDWSVPRLTNAGKSDRSFSDSIPARRLLQDRKDSSEERAEKGERDDGLQDWPE